MKARPRLELTLTTLDKGIERLCVFLLAILFVQTIFVYLKLPQTIPTHFNALGQPDAHGNKISLFILLLIATVVFIGLTTLNKYPHVLNYLTDITKENAAEQYGFATRMLRLVKLAVLLIFNALISYTYLISAGHIS